MWRLVTRVLGLYLKIDHRGNASEMRNGSSINLEAIAGMANVYCFCDIDRFFRDVFDSVGDPFDALRDCDEMNDGPGSHHLLLDEIGKFIIQSTSFFGQRFHFGTHFRGSRTVKIRERVKSLGESFFQGVKNWLQLIRLREVILRAISALDGLSPPSDLKPFEVGSQLDRCQHPAQIERHRLET